MILIPVETVNHKHDSLIVILGPDDLDRMRQADPAEIKLRETPATLVNPLIMICCEGDDPKLQKLLEQKDLDAIVEHLQRGWKYRPDRGDNDAGAKPFGKRQ